MVGVVVVPHAWLFGARKLSVAESHRSFELEEDGSYMRTRFAKSANRHNIVLIIIQNNVFSVLKSFIQQQKFINFLGVLQIFVSCRYVFVQNICMKNNSKKITLL